ncbi:hypothetical protein G647_06531 [Cladophialophora carrionii CBS 160.54]|uniref:BZIP domain-containing protein n=1 Tax=Cladophialophora carrionii CBS 160.54 TaxID=1279043 RepID=V9D749_9EURO|nr:uncharacterized protein G647_06531 [Cladophialophora carrionii CBS 160.54]ETI22456.1 hypothetical protein G647_06531 [Cladophialophora carrionii CBS 160.54]
MSTAFDSMYLPGGDFNASGYELLDFDAPQSHFAGVDGGTISPSDLFVDESIMSAPASTVFPNLSTPGSSFLESPAMASSGLNTSPLEDGLLDAQLNYSELEAMAPLFPQNNLDQFANQPMAQECLTKSSSFSSVNSHAQPSSMERQKSTGMERQKSSPGRPPSQPYHNRKRSDTCGISKPPRPRKQLPEIHVDSDDDKETAKRKKNTAAARKSRQRKQEHAEQAESEIQRLRAMIYRLGGDPDVDI